MDLYGLVHLLTWSGQSQWSILKNLDELNLLVLMWTEPWHCRTLHCSIFSSKTEKKYEILPEMYAFEFTIVQHFESAVMG